MAWLLALLAIQADPRELIERLRSDDPQVRDDAEKKLREMGDAAQPELEKAALDRDPEVADRARRMIRFGVIAIPGTRAAFEIIRIKGKAGLNRFCIGKHQVTWKEFRPFVREGRIVPENVYTIGGVPENADPDRPANAVAWHSAVAYCMWLSKKTGQRFRLPTESEWEAGCAVSLGSDWEYCLEPINPPAHGPVVKEVGGRGRQTIPAKWNELDPFRPHNLWWLTSEPSVGFRVVRVENSDHGYLAKMKVEILKVSEVRGSFLRVCGQIRNEGDRTLDEAEVTVHLSRDDGTPVFSDLESRPTFSVCYPVLAHSCRPEPRAPLQPNESRAFQVDVPQSAEVTGNPAAQVTGVSLGKE